MRNHYVLYTVRTLGALLTTFLLMGVCAFTIASTLDEPNAVVGKVICLDPGHGGTGTTDIYRKGPSGEREEWVNLRVAILLKELLEEKGAKVVMTRMEDVFVSLPDRAKIAIENKADLFLSIHHNATADSSVNFPIIYFHGNASENEAAVALGKHISEALNTKFYPSKKPTSIVSDHTIFASEGAGVLRATYGIPAVLSEASFFTNPIEEILLKQRSHNQKEAEAYLMAIQAFFSESKPSILEKNSLVKVSQFRGLQEAERMSEEAKSWHKDFQDGMQLMGRHDNTSMQKAYELFTRSARSFPDSYVARECHKNRVILLNKLDLGKEAREEEKRVKEFYVVLD